MVGVTSLSLDSVAEGVVGFGEDSGCWGRFAWEDPGCGGGGGGGGSNGVCGSVCGGAGGGEVVSGLGLGAGGLISPDSAMFKVNRI